MSKRFISLCLAISMLLTVGINVFASEDAEMISDESLTEAKSGTAGAESDNGAVKSQAKTRDAAAVPSVTKTEDNSTAVVEENKTKHNLRISRAGRGVRPCQKSKQRKLKDPRCFIP